MKEVVCTGKTFIHGMHICITISGVILLMIVMIDLKDITIGIGVALYLFCFMYHFLDFLNFRLRVDANGIEYQNLWKQTRKYRWDEINSVRWEGGGRGAGRIIFTTTGGKKIEVYVYYKNRRRLDEWLVKEEKYDHLKRRR